MYVPNRIERAAGSNWTLVLAEVKGGWDVFMLHNESGARVPEGPCVRWTFEAAEKEADDMLRVHNWTAPDLSYSTKCWACGHAAKVARNGKVFESHVVEGWGGHCPGSCTEPRGR